MITATQAVLQRIMAIQERLVKLDRGIDAPPEVHEAVTIIEERLAALEAWELDSFNLRPGGD